MLGKAAWGENEDPRVVMRGGWEGEGQPSLPSVAVSDSPEGKFSGSSQNKHMELYNHGFERLKPTKN